MKRSIVGVALVCLLAVAAPARADYIATFSGAMTFEPGIPCASPCELRFLGTVTGLIDGALVNGAVFSFSGIHTSDNCEVGSDEGAGVLPAADGGSTGFTARWTIVGSLLTMALSLEDGSSRSSTAALVYSPAVPPGCLPGGAPGPLTTAFVAGVL